MRRLFLVLLSASACFGVGTASALTIQVVGANGAPGVDGAPADAVVSSGDPSDTARAFGGKGGAGTALLAPGNGGLATATATVVAAPHANARAEAVGGGGGGSISAEDGGAGGGAMASAVAEGALSATAYARAEGGGDGGSIDLTGGAGGDATAFAYAHTSGDGHPVLAGATAPRVLWATAEGGRASVSPPGMAPGGNASSESIGEASGNSSVRVIDRASGGSGAAGGVGGTAWSSAIGRNAGTESVEVEAVASGGVGGAATTTTGGRGGDAALGPVYGVSSGGGAVSVRGWVRGGYGGDGIYSSPLPTAGDGASVLLHNAVDGDTSGSLYLEQLAEGGRAGELVGGAHGETSSTLEVRKSAQTLEVVALSQGAHNTESAASATNDTGSVIVRTWALGGWGRLAIDEPGEHGGDARARALGRTFGDGHAVLVTPRCSDCANAEGGEGAYLFDPSTSHPDAGGGRGGDADSRSEGIALGDSAVTVEDRAIGGAGGVGPRGGGAPGDGGAARSSAYAEGNGTSAVHATASALGGPGGVARRSFGLVSGPSARGGHADAIASAHGFGEVVALATATGGRSGETPWDSRIVNGDARARAVGIGKSGHVSADAFARGRELSRIHVTAMTPVRSEATVEASIDSSGAFHRTSLGALDAFAAASHLPENSAVEAAIGGSAQVAAAFADDAIDIVLALGQVGFTGLQNSDISLTQTARIEISPNVFLVSVLQDVKLGFMSPEFLGAGFESLRFRAAMGDDTLVDETFGESSAALAYFDDRVLDLGKFMVRGSFPFDYAVPLELVFDWTGSEKSSGFGVDLIVGLTPVPEPSTLLLCAFGLAVLAARERRRRGAAI